MRQIDYVANTGLTPINLEPYTEHGGGGFKKVVAVVAAVAIPIAAPMIASSIGLSAAIGSVMGSALVGAGLGAVAGSVTGQGVGRGALYGGISGGLAGFFRPGQTELPGRTFDNARFSGSQFRPDAGYTQNFQAGVVPGTNTPINIDMDGGVTQGQNFDVQDVQTLNDPGAGSTVGEKLSNTRVDGTGTVVDGSGAVSQTNLGTDASVMNTVGKTGVNTGSTIGIQNAGIYDVKLTGDRLADTGALLKSKFTSPMAIADVTTQLAVNVLGSELLGVGEPSDEEKALLNEQKAQLEELKKNNREAYDFAMAQAKRYLGLAENFDPNQVARTAYQTAKNKGALAKRDALASIDYNNPGLRAAEKRRFDLQTAANAATAYDSGMIAGLNTQSGLYNKAITAFPKSTGYSQALTGLQQSYANLAKKRSDARAGLNQMFGAFGVDQGDGNDRYDTFKLVPTRIS